VTLGGVIGVGILRTPGLVAAQVGSVPLVLVVWVLGGVYALSELWRWRSWRLPCPGPRVLRIRAAGVREYPAFVVGVERLAGPLQLAGRGRAWPWASSPHCCFGLACRTR
jgi:hypothetical protein